MVIETGERGLAREVIRKALEDYQKLDDSEDYKSAEYFLFNDEGGLKYWCSIAGIDAKKVMEILNEDKKSIREIF